MSNQYLRTNTTIRATCNMIVQAVGNRKNDESHMNPKNTIEMLKSLEPEIREKFPEVLVFYVFGSHARGEAHEKSDLDIAVFLEPVILEQDPLYELRLGAYLDKRMECEVDVVVMNKANPFLQHEVLRTGERLFETDPARRAKFELVSFKTYQDAKYYRRKRRAWQDGK